YAFVSILKKSRQKQWQLLPLNPTEEGQGHSPYSSVSSRAGNILFISPELLQRENLLTSQQLQEAKLACSDKINYRETEKTKRKLLDTAWETYNRNKLKTIAEEFELFLSKEQEWLNDFAMYMLLKQKNKNKPWYEWDKNYKNRDETALKNMNDTNQDELYKIKWFQFIYFRQWHQLKSFCNQSGIQLIGDLPFYISYDSADVWANREIFELDKEGNRMGMAGVPPDAFSADGQLWGMPVFKWGILKQQNYKWWVERFKKNMELFDTIRLDHFRAFAAFWKVPAGEQTARNGKWIPGPGSDLFKVIQEELGSLPFIAEDLGEIDDDVYSLRDEFNFPGMKVLQFAFGEDMPVNPYIPHNYTQNFIVYTGTHDNNTTLGWCHQEGKDAVKRLESYEARKLSENTIPETMCRLALSSIAKTAIIPVQDLLSLDENARMNIPSSGADNWGWRLLPGQLTNEAALKLKNWTELYNRL
ncbi:MAG TPA: 4-alpha-glucanotransferase, partial [Flavisolibacter sp.]|nr:4-alpha-glucanotransferase [Flavisolibacter sp.]